MKKLTLSLMMLCVCLMVQAQTTWTYGDHTYTMKGNLTAEKYNGAATGVVTFTNIPSDYEEFEALYTQFLGKTPHGTAANIPSDYEEFEALYTQFLGKTPHGTAAMMPMAMEIYGRNREEGLRCLQLINWPNNVSSVVSQLKQKFGTSQYAPANDGYHQRYLPAAVLKGAKPENAYTPVQPYTVEMKASVNKHQDMTFGGTGRVMYIYIMGDGWDTHQRSVEIIKQPDSNLHQVFNCPSLYTQCKQIRGEWPGLK